MPNPFAGKINYCGTYIEPHDPGYASCRCAEATTAVVVQDQLAASLDVLHMLLAKKKRLFKHERRAITVVLAALSVTHGDDEQASSGGLTFP